MTWRRVSLGVLLGVVSLALAGCARSGSPQDVVTAFVRAMSEGDIGKAETFLTDELRRFVGVAFLALTAVPEARSGLGDPPTAIMARAFPRQARHSYTVQQSGGDTAEIILEQTLTADQFAQARRLDWVGVGWTWGGLCLESPTPDDVRAWLKGSVRTFTDEELRRFTDAVSLFGPTPEQRAAAREACVYVVHNYLTNAGRLEAGDTIADRPMRFTVIRRPEGWRISRAAPATSK